MATWGYVAIEKSGKEVKGSKEADNKEALTRELKSQGLIVLEISEGHPQPGTWRFSADSLPVSQERA
jgi:type II secretory pathway component PulF